MFPKTDYSFAKFVTIVNRCKPDGSPEYTSGKRAASYCGRELAIQISRNEMAMLEEAELAMVRQARKETRALVSPEDPTQVHWYVGESGGSKFVREASGVATGYRLWQADTGEQQKATN